MFSYSEKTIRNTHSNTPHDCRRIEIWDKGEKVGCIEVRSDLSGKIIPVDSWRKETPIEVSYFDPEDEGREYRRTGRIGLCRSVAEGKQVFSKWYAENSGKYSAGASTSVKRLPSAPDAEFYPTPSSLAGQMAAMVDWLKVGTVLEPSAGKGDLLEYAAKCAQKKANTYKMKEKIMEETDCIEIDENLRHILTGKGCRVVHNDFLTFDTVKHYDLILMNPPFSNGDEHLLKAISMQQDLGGQIVCLLNAETIRNPYTNRRRVLVEKLGEIGATIRFVSGAFSRAERPSDVEVAIIYCNMPPATRRSFIFEGLERAQEEQRENREQPTDLVSGDWIDQVVAHFRMEAKAGVALMQEYNALAPYIMSGSESYDKPLIQLSVNDHKVDFAGSDTINAYLRKLRYKYWSSMMERKELTSVMTSQMQKEYSDKVRELQDYDFTRVNVERVIREIGVQLSRGVEDSIMALFDKLSAQHSWYPECKKNIHYYNGWATNKAHKVNSKVILPLNGFYARYDGKKTLEAYQFSKTICDIDRALSYLDGEGAISRIDPHSVASVSERNQRTSMTFSYFDATFYKKGTCHIKFHKEAQILVDRLNIFAARGRNWLPPSYGRKRYKDMSAEERSVVDEFQGAEEYESVMQDPARYIVSPAGNVPALTA